MTALYRRFVAPRTGDEVTYVASYENLTDEGRRAVECADIVVQQLFGVAPLIDLDDVTTSAQRLLIPNVSASFLWPYAGQPHPKNAPRPFLAAGAYVGEAGDSYLNRLILKGVDPDAAVAEYVGLDIASKANLDRLFELVMDRQRSRDDASGYRVAEVIERHFRDEPIFLTPHHPNLRVTMVVATELFRQLGASQDDIDLMRACVHVTPFPKEELPVHPGVARHFGLRWVTDDRRYGFLREGRFTFVEYAHRYVRFIWNEALAEGLSLAHAGDPVAAERMLRDGLAQSPQSGSGWEGLSRVLHRLGRKSEAVDAARRAVAAEPDGAALHVHLGHMLRHNGEMVEAEISLRRGIELQPTESHFHALLGHLLRDLGRLDEAAASLRTAIRFDPYSAHLHGELATTLEQQGALDEAERMRRRAVALDPVEPRHRRALLDLLVRRDRLPDAIAEVRALLQADPDDLSTLQMLVG
ncbi:MAG: tetratricopeptide repeat protein, partial [Rhodospirillales bacterium]|nr:tetratricopeptide repeat protein [Rhodospirillales bacterium]